MQLRGLLAALCVVALLWGNGCSNAERTSEQVGATMNFVVVEASGGG